jgi:hypothetical protein
MIPWSHEREHYYEGLKTALDEKYTEPKPTWKPLEQKSASGQLINDCVISLLCLSASLKNQEPVLEVDPSFAPVSRTQIILELLGELNGAPDVYRTLKEIFLICFKF